MIPDRRYGCHLIRTGDFIVSGNHCRANETRITGYFVCFDSCNPNPNEIDYIGRWFLENYPDRGESPLISTILRPVEWGYGWRSHNSLILKLLKISKKRVRINQFIRVPQVRLIDENNEQVGIVSTQEALRMSEERGFDLVEIAPLAQPPVCQLMDYGAYKYRQEKAVRKSKSRQKKIDVKGIRLTLIMGQHDFDHRVNQAKKFLADGDKVKIEMLLRGRQMQHQDRARDKFDEFIKQLEGVKIEQALSRQGKRYTMLIGTNA